MTAHKWNAASRRRRHKAIAGEDLAQGSSSNRDLLQVKHCACRRYRSWPNVLAVGIGTKFKRPFPASATSRRVKGVTCVQFFVTRKRRIRIPHRQLPRFVYGRFRNGRVDYGRKIPTDVIPVGAIQAACGAGSFLDAPGERGLITLIFRNRAEAGRPFYLVSCAHVAGDIHRSPPAYDELTSDCSAAAPFARTLVNSTARGNEIAYDIALARIEARALPLPELRIRGEAFSLKSFLSRRSLQPGLGVTAVLRNRSTRGAVDSLEVTANVVYAGQSCRVHNLFGMNVTAGKGDSGGLIYRDTQAVGIVVAASPEGWIWFQPLQSAVSFLNNISPVNLAVFNP
jgi:hypothetical protein